MKKSTISKTNQTIPHFFVKKDNNLYVHNLLFEYPKETELSLI